jgi:hypothetical protein
VLTHPLIGDQAGKMGGVIAREELVRTLMELAAGGVTKPDAEPGLWKSLALWLSGEQGPRELGAEAKKTLADALKKAGIERPDQVLDNICSTALKLEATHPALSAQVRHTLAIVQEAPGIFVARLNAWFDQTMDRVSESFVNNTRKVTAVCGLIVALGLQLDAVDLLKRLSTDDELRKAVAGQYATVLAAYDQAKAGTGADQKAAEQSLGTARQRLQDFSVTGYDLWPAKWEWPWQFPWEKAAGILLTAVLLSLGAPFWFSALKNLVNLRPLLAGKDEVARAERSTEQIQPAAAAPPPASIGERGDLTAAG